MSPTVSPPAPGGHDLCGKPYTAPSPAGGAFVPPSADSTPPQSDVYRQVKLRTLIDKKKVALMTIKLNVFEGIP